jgi:hypothetical protein
MCLNGSPLLVATVELYHSTANISISISIEK